MPHPECEAILSLACRRVECDIIATKTIVLTHSAAKDLDALPPEARSAVGSALIDYAMTGRGDVKRLTGREGFRMRVGRYRVLFDEDQKTVIVIYFGKRETATYRRDR